jgi:hypothetical protein
MEDFMQRNLPVRITEMNRKSGAAPASDVSAENPSPFADHAACVANPGTPTSDALFHSWNRKTLTIAGAGAAVAALLLAAAFFVSGSEPVVVKNVANQAPIRAETKQRMESKTRTVAELAQSATVASRFAPAAAPPLAIPQGPLIARTVSLTILAKDLAASRPALDKILTQVHGYPASLTVNTPETGGRSLQASLRIPATDLPSALSSLRTLGRVLSETQSGEEVTQQHADLVARLQNSREEETRLRAILKQRTGKIEDVLQVEEAIAGVRGEIESMEAEQKSLEHRVDFATVDLQLTEEYKEQLGLSPGSASTRMYNALIAGLRNASDSVLGIVLFLEEFGPAILVWLFILGLPALLAWRRYQRTRASM